MGRGPPHKRWRCCCPKAADLEGNQSSVDFFTQFVQTSRDQANVCRGRAGFPEALKQQEAAHRVPHPLQREAAKQNKNTHRWQVEGGGWRRQQPSGASNYEEISRTVPGCARLSLPIPGSRQRYQWLHTLLLYDSQGRPLPSCAASPPPPLLHRGTIFAFFLWQAGQ